MAEVLLSLLLAIATMAGIAVALYWTARFVGLGRCMACRRGCPPWAAYCWRHRPDCEECRRG